jgi:hypothetical protein
MLRPDVGLRQGRTSGSNVPTAAGASRTGSDPRAASPMRKPHIGMPAAAAASMTNLTHRTAAGDVCGCPHVNPLEEATSLPAARHHGGGRCARQPSVARCPCGLAFAFIPVAGRAAVLALRASNLAIMKRLLAPRGRGGGWPLADRSKRHTTSCKGFCPERSVTLPTDWQIVAETSANSFEARLPGTSRCADVA